MQSQMIRPRCRLVVRPLVAALLMAGASGARADDDPNPYYIGVSQSFTHDSNVFRTPTARGDSYSSTGLVGGLDQPIGRQRVYASGNVRTNRFQDISELNNISYGLNAGLDWSTIERLSGTVKLSLNESLATYGSTNQQQLSKKNVENNGQFQARVQWGLVSLLSLDSAFTHQQLRYSAPEYNRYETNQDAVSFGVKYRPSGPLTLGAGLRHTRGDYPNVTNVSGSKYAYSRNDLDLTANWIPTGRSTVQGRLSFGKQRYNDASARDFSGTTGALTWLYRPTGKLSFSTALSRDTGQESSFQSLNLNGTPATAIGDNSRLTNSLSLNGGYSATGKINVNAGARYVRRSLVDTLALSNGVPIPATEGRDTIRSVSLGATYTPTRNWLLACNVARDSRSVSEGTALSSYPYTANTASCSAQFTLQ